MPSKAEIKYGNVMETPEKLQAFQAKQVLEAAKASRRQSDNKLALLFLLKRCK
jgi:hypothetical protein